MPQMLSKTALKKKFEEPLHKAANLLNDYVDAGDHPTTALIKVAKEMSLQPPVIRLLARSYNVSAGNHQRDQNDDLTQKCAEFSLADAEHAIETCFPGKNLAQAVAEKKEAKFNSFLGDEYAIRTAVATRLNEKRAADLQAQFKKSAKTEAPKDPIPTLKSASLEFLEAALSVQKGRYEEVRLKHAQMADKVRTLLGDLRHYFEKAGSLDINVVRHNARQVYGAEACKLFDEGIGKYLRFDVVDDFSKMGYDRFKPIDWDSDPYRQIGETILLERERAEFAKRAEDEFLRYKAVQREFDSRGIPLHDREKTVFDAFLSDAEFAKKAEEERREKDKGKSPFGQAFDIPLSTTAKVVSAAEKPATVTASTFMSALPFSKKPESSSSNGDSAVTNFFDKLSDPETDYEMNRASVKAMMHDLIAHDPVISKQPPNEVFSRYNTLAELAPKLMLAEGPTRALLRAALLDNMQPFEYQQTITTDKALRPTHKGSK